MDAKKPLAGKIALVTGASRGVGKGIAIGLGEAGATVYLTARTTRDHAATIPLPGTLDETADEVRAAGGVAIALQCDHADNAQTKTVFDQIARDHGALDILINNVWGGYEYFNDGTAFWEERGFWTVPLERWDKCFVAGVRAHYVCAVLAAPGMIAAARGGLIVNVSFSAATKDDAGVIYSTAKAADDRLTATMAHELRPHSICVASLYPGLVRTEAVMKAKEHFDLTNSESPQFLGRVVAALANDAERMAKSGRPHYAAELAQAYGVTDIDGAKPMSEPQ